MNPISASNNPEGFDILLNKPNQTKPRGQYLCHYPEVHIPAQPKFRSGNLYFSITIAYKMFSSDVLQEEPPGVSQVEWITLHITF